ncbi:protein SLC31A2 [Genypterus blacodes]|uniref:protein SLC31A2 n=1 Tax=Genypterus blacodes TaxID=154954 RepID=UPI003F76AAE8
MPLCSLKSRVCYDGGDVLQEGLSCACLPLGLWITKVIRTDLDSPPRPGSQQQIGPGRECFDGGAESLITAESVGSARNRVTMMSMTFEASSSVTLLFDFWSVHGPAGMVLSVFVVLLLTVFYEVLKVWRLWLGAGSRPASPGSLYSLPHSISAEDPSDGGAVLGSAHSESSLTPIQTPPPPAAAARDQDSWLLHVVQTVLHMLQVTLGYMLMLCVMSYNIWIFIGVVAGSVLGYFLSFPLLRHI